MSRTYRNIKNDYVARKKGRNNRYGSFKESDLIFFVKDEEKVSEEDYYLKTFVFKGGKRKYLAHKKTYNYLGYGGKYGERIFKVDNYQEDYFHDQFSDKNVSTRPSKQFRAFRESVNRSKARKAIHNFIMGKVDDVVNERWKSYSAGYNCPCCIHY